MYRFARAAVLARLNPDGSLDQGFRSANAPPGKVLLNLPFWRELRAIVLQKTKIVVAGQWFSKLALARHLPSGARDRSFFGDGIFSASFGSGYARGVEVLAGPGGRLLAMGHALFGEDRPSALVARLLP